MRFLSPAIFLLLAWAPAPAQELTLADKEEFLLKGDILTVREVPVGVTRPRRASMEYKGVKHDAHVQTINERKASFTTQRGTELNFRDYYGFNIVAYELDKLLGLNMTPPSVERRVKGQSAAVSWWVDDVAMMEVDRMKKKIEPPDPDDWNKQMFIVRVINELTCDTDANLTNLLITRDWKLWTVDRTRAFRALQKIPNPKNLVKCERRLLARLREVTREDLKPVAGNHLNRMELDGLEARREQIVKWFDGEIARKGEVAVLYDLPPRK